MSLAVRVLVVDDSEDDTLLLMDELRNGEFDPEYIRVDTPEAMKSALTEQPWQIIIADYTMPRFSGPEALEVLRESGLDIPLILVSGTAEEHTGVDMMRAGAQDFIVKHSLSRLAPAVAREIGEAEGRRRRRKAEAAAKTSDDNYWMMFEHSPVAIVTYDHDGVILKVNGAFEELFGYSAQEVVGRRMYEILGLTENTEAARSQAARIFEGEIVRNAECEYARKDGAPVYAIANITPVNNDDGEVIMALAAIVDITEHKQSEAHKRDFYRRTILAATDGKLLISEKEEIDGLPGSVIGSWTISSKEELGDMRDDVSRLAVEEGMDEARVPGLLACVVESGVNAIKHANGGRASLSRRDDTLVFTISDTGQGISALALPDVALSRGYSTAGTLGMGYKVMIASAERLYLATGPEGTTVAAEIKICPEESEIDAALRKLPGW